MLTSVANPNVAAKAIVLFDGDCAFCQRSVRILKSLDWFHKLSMQNARDESTWPVAAEALSLPKMLDEMHLVTPDRQHTYAGFAAFRWMSWRLPITLPLAPFLYLPGVPWIGNRAYRWIARNRYSLVPCRDGVCEVPSKK